MWSVSCSRCRMRRGAVSGELLAPAAARARSELRALRSAGRRCNLGNLPGRPCARRSCGHRVGGDEGDASLSEWRRWRRRSALTMVRDGGGSGNEEVCGAAEGSVVAASRALARR